jgi:hypothetical protein
MCRGAIIGVKLILPACHQLHNPLVPLAGGEKINWGFLPNTAGEERLFS